MAETTSGFDQWGIVEVMGHKKYAGHIIEQTIGSASLLRVDVPEVTTKADKTVPAYSKLIGIGSVYMITPTTEELARKAAAVLALYDADPLPVFIPPEKQIPSTVPATEATTVDNDWDVDDEDDFDEQEGG